MYAELYHHGIRGQKWGVRRYQNLDGSYKNAMAKARHAKDQAENAINDYREAKAEKKAAKKAEKEAKPSLKERLTSDKAKATYKKVAKGAAITAGVLAAGYVAHLGVEHAIDSRNFKQARALTESIMASNFGDLDTPRRNVVSKAITTGNYNVLTSATKNQRMVNRQLVSDVFDAYVNPKTANADARNSLRSKVRTGGYKVDPWGLITSENVNEAGRSKGLRSYAEQVVNPAGWRASVEQARREASKQTSVGRRSANEIFEEMARRMKANGAETWS